MLIFQKISLSKFNEIPLRLMYLCKTSRAVLLLRTNEQVIIYKSFIYTYAEFKVQNVNIQLQQAMIQCITHTCLTFEENNTKCEG